MIGTYFTGMLNISHLNNDEVKSAYFSDNESSKAGEISF